MSNKFKFFIRCKPPTTTGNSNKKVGRNRETGKAIQYTSSKAKDVEDFIWAMLLQHRPKQQLEGPLRVKLAYISPYIKVDQSSKKKVEELKRNPALWNTSKPDIDNILKILFDQMTNMNFWQDDRKICDLHVLKIKGKETGIFAEAEEIEEAPDYYEILKFINGDLI